MKAIRCKHPNRQSPAYTRERGWLVGCQQTAIMRRKVQTYLNYNFSLHFQLRAQPADALLPMPQTQNMCSSCLNPLCLPAEKRLANLNNPFSTPVTT